MITHFITIHNRRYKYFIGPSGSGNAETSHFLCPAANIDQDVANEDVAELLQDLPQWIIEEQERKGKELTIRFRVGVDEKKQIEHRAVQHGFASVSQYLRHLALNG